MTTVAIVYHSATGRTKALAEAAAAGALEVEGTLAPILAVEDVPRIHTVLAASDAIIFGCPTYMGSASAAFKAFMDSTSAVWALQGWRDKLAAAFTHSAALSGDKLGTLTQLAVFAAQHGMVWVGLGLPPTYATTVGDESDDTNRLGSHLGAMAQSRPGGAVPESDLKTALLLGRRVAEAARRWTRPRAPSPSMLPLSQRHDAARGWAFPPPNRPLLLDGNIERTNLREIVGRPDRYEHHLIVCATVDNVQLEIVTASEPLYFAHVNLSDEYAVALPSGDDLVDRFPLRTFLSDPVTGEDVGRYNHRIGDLVLHPERYLHWPGRLRPPYEPFDFPPGMRRAGLSLVYCANKPTPPTWCPLPISADRAGDLKAYSDPAPPMVLASLRGGPGQLAAIGRTTLSLVELPETISPPHGGWVVVLEVLPNNGSGHAACDLLRIPKGAQLDGKGIVRALVLMSDQASPDPIPPSWSATPTSSFLPFEDRIPPSSTRLPSVPPAGTPGSATGGAPALISQRYGLKVEELDPRLVAITAGHVTSEVPRYWLARMLFRVLLHDLRLGYIETYGGFFIDDRGLDSVLFGIRVDVERHSISVPRDETLAFVDRLYRSVAPHGYTERPT